MMWTCLSDDMRGSESGSARGFVCGTPSAHRPCLGFRSGYGVLCFAPAGAPNPIPPRNEA